MNNLQTLDSILAETTTTTNNELQSGICYHIAELIKEYGFYKLRDLFVNQECFNLSKWVELRFAATYDRPMKAFN